MAATFARAMARLNNQAYLLIGFATVCWGANVVLGRLAVGQISPMSVTCGRWFVVCAILAATIRHKIVAEWPLVVPAWRKLAIIGALGFTVFNALFYLGAHYTTAVNMAVIQGTYPAFVLVGMALAYGARIVPLQMLGIAVTFIGVAIIACQGDLAALRGLAFNRGDVLLLIATIIFAVYTVAMRDRPKASSIVIFAALAVGACATSIIGLGIEMAMGLTMVPTVKGLVVLAIIAVGPSLFAQICFIRGIELIGPSRTGTFYNLVPVFGALFAVAILGEAFRLYHAVAIVLVLGGIWLAERAKG